MEQDQAAREVQDIKRIMEESRRRVPTKYPAAGVLLLVGAVVAMLFYPLLAPIIALVLVAGGIVFYVKADSRGEKRLAAAAIAIGSVVLIVGLLIIAALVPIRTDVGTSDLDSAPIVEVSP